MIRLIWLLGIFFGIVVGSFAQTTAKDIERRQRFENSIQKLEQKSKTLSVDQVHTVFVGSSSFTLWVDFEKDFNTDYVVNNGFGGSQLSDVIYFFDRIITPFQPKQIIVYEGDNDISAGMTAEEYMADVRTFCRMVDIKLPGTHIAFLPPKPSPSRKHLLPEYEKASKMLFKYSQAHSNIDFIDISQVMFTLEGEIMKDIWKSDSLHMNRKGYELWAPIVKTYIRK